MYSPKTLPAQRPPLRYMIDAARGLLLVDLLEIGSAPAVVEALAEIQTDPAFRPTMNVWIECGFLSRIPTRSEVRALACACVAAPRPDVARQWAIIATWSCVYDAARLFAVLTSTPNDRVRVFRSPSDASQWLTPSLGRAPTPATHEWPHHPATRRVTLAQP